MSDQSERLKAIGEYLEKMSKEPWKVLEVMSRRFVAGVPYPGHPYYERTRFFDIAGDEDYPTKDADLDGIAALRTDAPWLRSQLLAEIQKREEAERLLRRCEGNPPYDELSGDIEAYFGGQRGGCDIHGGCGLPGHESEVEHGKD